MPTYEYICRGCGHEMETFQRMTEDPLTDCPECEQSELQRKIGRGAGIIFKGGGFYETDFKDKKGGSDGSAKASTSGSENGKSPTSKDTSPTPSD